MKKSPSKKGVERRKKPRGGGGRGQARPKPEARAHASQITAPDTAKDVCRHCGIRITGEGRALFVEEEVGRIFCSEDCISAYYAPEVQRLEKEYFRIVSHDELSSKEREQFGHLRWITLQEPDEIWREKTVAGDYRYTLISQFQPGSRPLWSVCVCLFLRGEPSFLYLAFATRNANAVEHYRRGERMERMQPAELGTMGTTNAEGEYVPVESAETGAMDRLAPEWTDDETLRAQWSRERRSDDILPADFPEFTQYMEPTLQEPDEVWSTQMGEGDPTRIFQFIRRFEEKGQGFWYIIVAKETESEEELEVLDAFPTRDPHMVDSFRRGDQQVGEMEPPANSRIVH